MPGQKIVLADFSGGLNQKFPPTDILDNQMVDALNVELDSERNVRTRRGTTNVSANDATGSVSFTDRITSLAYHETGAGARALVATSGAAIARYNDADDWLDITGGLSLPDDTYWDWAQFGDILIGANRADTASGKTNPVKIADTSSDAVALAGSPPKANLVVAVNDRVFIVDADNPNKVAACKLGDAENWTDSTKHSGAETVDVGGSEYGPIKSLVHWRGSLWALKRNAVYELRFGNPNTDKEQWSVIKRVDGIGTISHYSVQEVLGDLVFLSDEGIMSLSTLLQGGDAQRALMSEFVTELRDVPKTVDTYPSVVYPTKSQYMISIPSSGTQNDRTWVMDYSALTSGRRAGGVAWFPFDGKVAAASMLAAPDSNGDIKLWIGSPDEGAAGNIYRYDDAGVWQDDGTDYDAYWVSKAYTFGAPLLRKAFRQFGVEYESLTDPAAFKVSAIFGQQGSRSKSWSGSFTNLKTGGKWDEAKWDQDNWASEINTNTDLVRTIRGDIGWRAQSIQFRHERTGSNQGLSWKSMFVDVQGLDERYVSEV